MSPFTKNLALWLVIGLSMILLFNIFNQSQPTEKELIFSDFIARVDEGEVAEVTLKGSDIRGQLTDGTRFRTFAPQDPELVPTLRKKGVKIAARPVEQNPWYNVLLSWLPMLLFIGVWIFFMRQMQGGG
ncbi:MAG: ATP-dependent metallopeptidase FtsH/Yme1/Tma family protein, partial [Candidatus Methylomirabilales bacterium]